MTLGSSAWRFDPAPHAFIAKWRASGGFLDPAGRA